MNKKSCKRLVMEHSIELSTPAVKATRKLFDNLTENDLKSAGFNESDIESLGELYREIKSVCEDLEIAGEPYE